MGLFEHWPYANFHEMNLDWIIKKIKNVETAEANTQEYAEAAAADALSALHSKEAAAESAESAAGSAASMADKVAQIDRNTAQIENIIVTGTPTEGNAELIDGRLAYNNVRYATLGEAIRTQAGDLADSVESITGYTVVHDILKNFQIAANAEVSGSLENGIRIVKNNEAVQVVSFVDISTNSVSLEGGKMYLLTVESNPARADLENIRIELRSAADDSVLVARETSMTGSSFIPNVDIDCKLYARVAPGYNADMTFRMTLVEYKNNIDERIRLAKDGKNDPYENMLSHGLRETFTESGVSFTNNDDDTITIVGTAANTIGTRISSGSFKLKAGSTYILASNNDKDLQPSSESFRMDIRSSNNGTPVNYEKFKSGFAFTPDADGLYFIGFRIMANYEIDMTISPVMYEIENYKNKTGNILKICAYNVGNFSHGSSATAAGTDEMYNSFIQAFQKADADVYMFSEWDEYWNSQEQQYSDDVLGSLKPYKTVEYRKQAGDYVAQMIYSDEPFYNETVTYFADGEARHFVDNVIISNGKEVHLICTHLPWSSEALRRSDIEKVFNYINNKNIEYYIIGGDFNLGTNSNNPDQSDIITIAREDVNIIESHNCTSVQGGFWGLRNYDGFMRTFEGDIIKPYDDIVISNNMRIRNAYTIDSDASDHIPLIAEIEII